MGLIKRLSQCERAELQWKDSRESYINNLFLDGNYKKCDELFLGKSDVKEGILYKLCKHYYLSNINKYPSLKYTTLEDFHAECCLNYLLTMKSYVDDINIPFKRQSSSELWATHGNTKINPLYFYSSIVGHVKYIMQDFVSMTGKDKVKANYSCYSLDKIIEDYSDHTTMLAME